MSFPNIPNVTPNIDLSREQVINLLLASIAFEELGLSHIINAEAEKIQFILGTIPDQTPPVSPPTIADIIDINNSVDQTLKTIIKKEMLLQFKLENVINIPSTTSTTTTVTTTSTTSTTTTTTTEPIDAGSAWAVGTNFGEGNAQYTTLVDTETEKTVVLGLGNDNIPVGTVDILRSGNNLAITYTTETPYIMNQVHLYVNDVAPTNSAPGSFPYQYTTDDPDNYFMTYTFNVDASTLTGDTIYIAAHAHILQQQ